MTGSSKRTVVRVLAAIIRRDDCILLCKRPLHKRHGGLWEFPGGKIEEGESPFDACRRELYEELRLDVMSVGGYLFEYAEADSRYVIEFAEAEVTGEAVPTEHEAIAWVQYHEALTMELAPADAAYVAYVLGDARDTGS